MRKTSISKLAKTTRRKNRLKMFQYLLSRLSSIMSYNLVTDRCSGRHWAFNGLYIGYCIFLSVRFVVYSLALRYSFEPYLRWDRFFATVDPNGAFDHYAILCWSVLPFCGAYFRYLFFVHTDSGWSELCSYFLGLKRNFFALNPQFKIGFRSGGKGEDNIVATVQARIHELNRVWTLRK